MIGILAGVRRVPGWLWAGLAVFALLWGALRWHQGQLHSARAQGAAAQAAIDRAAFAEAAAAAAAAQGALVARLAAQAAVISKGSDDALEREHEDLARRYDALRLRWAEAGAGARGAGTGGAVALSHTAGAADDAACAARGWVDFETASAAAEAADRAIAKDDAWIAWAAAQAAVWPQ